ncbi:MAG: GrpB family protein [Candidatus Bathyarchaeota archaeon]|nr:GrpB family protein [Candidatus Bathyarchaeota archaeon]
MLRPVTIVEYDPEWPSLYEKEKGEIIGAIGRIVKSIEHIGSTSVPGLAAKPIVDIMAGVDSEAEADRCIAILADIGYDDVTPQPENPDWYYCLGKRLDSIYCHLHLVRQGSAFLEDHLLLRDHLRESPRTAREYHELKKELAAKYKYDRLGYNLAKTDFIRSKVEMARKKRDSMLKQSSTRSSHSSDHP